MGRSEACLNAIKAGATDYVKLHAALPDYSEHQLHAGISYLKHSKQITKTGTGQKSIFGIAVKEVEVPAVKEAPVSPPVVGVQDFNQMFQHMVTLLSDEIVAKAKERVYTILNTPELADEVGQEIMNRFSLPVVVFKGDETTTLTFNKTPISGMSVGAPIHMESIHKCETEVAKIDMSAIQPPKDPEVQPPRKRLPRICVTGLKPIEAGRISQEFGETFDLVFWNDRNGDGVDQLRAHSNNCQALFWHVKHGSHSNESISRAGTAAFFRVNGDLSQMRNKLREYYTQLTTEKSLAA